MKNIWSAYKTPIILTIIWVILCVLTSFSMKSNSQPPSPDEPWGDVPGVPSPYDDWDDVPVPPDSDYDTEVLPIINDTRTLCRGS